MHPYIVKCIFFQWIISVIIYNNNEIEVTNGLFTYVKIDDDRKPIKVKK